MAYTERLATIDPLIGEAFALAESAMLARRHKWSKVIFECNSLVVCNVVLSHEPCRFWAIADLVAHIRWCFGECSKWRIAWVPRRCNRLAHNLAS
ncbi:hypothetical protein CJ030_MR7G008070 [Morella rubra]|uniref:RNase H type-1 domain-containing protein n=1 Tax=Morella rubra TaxID=262757 RepID=A0A6A1V2S7_9ROSI|nr:hypothetical protein CJ030_MR7G008070 [Morella rubra]